MGMDVYAWAEFEGGKRVCMMCWRKPYALASWFFDHLPLLQRWRPGDGYTIEITPKLYAKAAHMAEADIDAGDGLFWDQWTAANFDWRLSLALENGAKVTLVVSP